MLGSQQRGSVYAWPKAVGSTCRLQYDDYDEYVQDLMNGDDQLFIFKYLSYLFIFCDASQKCPILAGSLVCWLLVCLFVSLMDATCQNVLVKSNINILWQKRYVFFMTHLNSLSNNVKPFIFYRVVMYLPFCLPQILKDSNNTQQTKAL